MKNKKKNGSYYTPVIIADFIVKRLSDIRHYFIPNKLVGLEPSVGDGIFIESLLKNLQKNIELDLDIVEKSKPELKKAEDVVKNQKSRNVKLNAYRQDYLEFQSINKKKYDLIIGNPPYIKKNHLSNRQLKICEAIHKQAGLSNKRIKNIWTAFLVSAVDSLSESGTLCFVLPGELLQVSYAKELREYLSKKLNKIEIFAFNELVFEGIEQDVIILIGTKSTKNKSVSFFQANKLEDLKKPDLIPGNTNIDRKTLDKWTNYILSQEELVFLDGFKTKLKAVKDYAGSQVGIVTAVNKFFIINQEAAKKSGLLSHCKPILQKSSLIPSCAVIRSSDFKLIKKKGKPVLLLSLADKGAHAFPRSVREYIKQGEELKLHDGYKCSLRKNWHHVPSVWSSKGLFVKRSNIFPRIIVNEANLMVTDAFYRITMKRGYLITDLAVSFLNSLSFIFAELEGRYYGGGVLELIPSEFKNLPIPYVKIAKSDFSKVDKMLRDKISQKAILDFTDDLILKKGLKLPQADFDKIKAIYAKLLNRRLKIL